MKQLSYSQQLERNIHNCKRYIRLCIISAVLVASFTLSFLVYSLWATASNKGVSTERDTATYQVHRGTHLINGRTDVVAPAPWIQYRLKFGRSAFVPSIIIRPMPIREIYPVSGLVGGISAVIMDRTSQQQPRRLPRLIG
jgi:hypothetical protein